MRSTHPVLRFTHTTIPADGPALPAGWRWTFFGVDPLHHQVIARSETGRRDLCHHGMTGSSCRRRTRRFVRSISRIHRRAVNGRGTFGRKYTVHGQNYQSQIDPATGRSTGFWGRDLPRERDVDLTGRRRCSSSDFGAFQPLASADGRPVCWRTS